MHTGKTSSDLTKVIQNKLLEMLKDVDHLFRQNDIEYFVACGTVLGAVRHKGFIPWDDDVDLYVTWDNYKKIQKLFEGSNIGNLTLHSWDTVDNYPYDFPKIVATDTVLVENSLKHLDYKCGVYIDIFPIIETSDNKLIRKYLNIKRYLHYSLRLSHFAKFSSPLKSFVSCLFRHCSSAKSLNKFYEKFYSKNYNGKKYYMDTSYFNEHGLLHKSWFEKSEIMFFEDMPVPVPVNAEAYLSSYYGDYMKIPDEDDQVSNHDFSTLIIGDTKII